MSKSTTPALSPEEQARREKFLADLEARKERLRLMPHLDRIGNIAVFFRMLLLDLAELRRILEGKGDAPTDAFDDESLTCAELLRDVAGWSWVASVGLATLRSNFSYDVSEAMKESGFDEGEEAEDDEEGDDIAPDDSDADTPVVAELPPAHTRPYWLS